MSLSAIWDNLFSLSPTNFFSALRGLVWSKDKGEGGGGATDDKTHAMWTYLFSFTEVSATN